MRQTLFLTRVLALSALVALPQTASSGDFTTLLDSTKNGFDASQKANVDDFNRRVQAERAQAEARRQQRMSDSDGRIKRLTFDHTILSDFNGECASGMTFSGAINSQGAVAASDLGVFNGQSSSEAAYKACGGR